MLPKLPEVNANDLREALAADRCRSGQQVRVSPDILRELNFLSTWASKEAGARVDSLRRAQVSGAVAITLAVARQVEPRDRGLAVGFSVAEVWLAKCGALLSTRVAAAWTQLSRDHATPGVDSVDVVATAVDQIVSDPLTVFVAGPITNATRPETESLVAITTRLRTQLVQLRVRLYSAPEEADPRVNRELADDDCWRDVDEHWIRRSDLVVILHSRPATGLGVVHEVATGACVPVLLVADEPVSPMVARSMTAERLLETTSVVDKVFAYVEERGAAMLQRRSDVRATAADTWRPGRMRLKRDIEALANASLESWTLMTMTRARLREVTSDDYAYGSMTEFERMQLRQAFALEKVRPLTNRQSLALDQARRNNAWSDELAWFVELAGRELIEAAHDAGIAESHYKQPHSPGFWEDVRRDLRS